MGVWDMMYLVQQYKKALEHADNPAFSPQTRIEFSIKAENLRAQMARCLARVQEEYRAELTKKEETLTEA
jgi:hypothetical protein